MTHPTQKHPDRHQRRATSLAALAALCLAGFANGCANTSHMALYQHTVLGVNGAVNPENSNIHVKVGYSREFITIIPKVKEPNPTEVGSPGTELEFAL